MSAHRWTSVDRGISANCRTSLFAGMVVLVVVVGAVTFGCPVAVGAGEPVSAGKVVGAGDGVLGINVDEIGRYVGEWHAAGRFNGAVLVAQGEKVLFERGYGLADREWDVPVRPDTRFHVGSIAKQLTTVMVFQLAAEGRLKLSDRIVDHLPDYRRDTGERVTIDHLLQHTSGLPCYVRDSRPGTDGSGEFEWHVHYTRSELITQFMSEDLLFEPGSEYHYSSTGHFLLACIIEKVTGVSYGENLRRRLLEPLGMKDTAMEMPGALMLRRARGYAKVPGGYATVPGEYPPNLVGAGNLFSTAEDLYKWNRALRGDALLPEEWRRKMSTVYWSGAFESHGYVFNHFARRLPSGETLSYTGFSGALPGYASDVFYFADSDLTVVLLDNSSQYNHWMIGPGIHGIVAGLSVRGPDALPSDRIARTAVEEGVAAAVALYGKMRSESPDRRDLGGVEDELNTLGYNALRVGMLGPALAAFKVNVELFPASWNVHDSLGEAYHDAGMLELSAKCYARANEIKNREDDLLKLIRERLYAEATAKLNEIRSRQPEVEVFTPSRIGPMFGEALHAGDHDHALAITRIWILGNPKAPGPYFSQARVFESLSRPEEAAANYRRIIEISPDGPHAKRARSALEKLGVKEVI